MTFLALLLGILLPVWGLFLLVRRGKHQLDAALAYREVAHELGLAVDTRGVSVNGHIDEQRLWVGEVMVGHGKDRRTAIWGVLDLKRPLGLGLQIRRRGLSERVFRRGRAPGVELGDPFDREVELLGDSPPRIRALVGEGRVKTSLKHLIERWPDVVVTDASVRVHLRRHEVRSQNLIELVTRMRAVADELSQARRAVSPPDRLQPLVTSWASLGERLNLVLEPWLPALSAGPPRRTRVCLVRDRRGYLAEVTVELRNLRPIGLRVGEQHGPDGYWSVGQDIQIGDPAFDPAFVVKGWDPEKVRARLTDEARAILVGLLDVGQPAIDDHHLVVREHSVEADALEPTIQALWRLAEILERPDAERSVPAPRST